MLLVVEPAGEDSHERQVDEHRDRQADSAFDAVVQDRLPLVTCGHHLHARLLHQRGVQVDVVGHHQRPDHSHGRREPLHPITHEPFSYQRPSSIG